MFILSSVYGLSSPTKKETTLRDKKVQICKDKMGDKWLLAKSIERKEIK